MRASLGVLVFFFALSDCFAALAEEEPAQQDLDIAQVLYRQLAPCWWGIEDLPEPERLAVTVEFRLDENGALVGDPIVLSPAQVSEGDRYMEVAVSRAIGAVERCQPYILPRDEYEIGQKVTVRFGSS